MGNAQPCGLEDPPDMSRSGKFCRIRNDIRRYRMSLRRTSRQEANHQRLDCLRNLLNVQQGDCSRSV